VKATQTSAKKAPSARKTAAGFTAEERAAMRDRAQEIQAAARRGPRAGEQDGEAILLAKIAEMPDADRDLAQRLHALITRSVPALAPTVWYGMPAYAKEGKVICHFQAASKFRLKYATLGFSDKAKLDDGAMWPVAFALTKWTPAEEARIEALLKRAVG
jgi:hypothetical protein